MGVRASSTLDGLAQDLEKIASQVRPDGATVLRDQARAGNEWAKTYARRSAGKHGRRYPNSMSAAKAGPLAYEYGPTEGRAQGGMSFEHGSRNQPPHNDLAKSLDRIRPGFSRNIDRMVDGWFWPSA